MNYERRTKILKVVAAMSEIRHRLRVLERAEALDYDNLSEAIQNTEAGELACEYADGLKIACDELQCVYENLQMLVADFKEA